MKELLWMRNQGWRVAVHNDYEQDGAFHTFWLFTHKASGRFVKGEGRTDLEALREATFQVQQMERDGYINQ